MPGFSPILPLSLDNIDGFALTKSYHQVAKQNLKNLILTNPGEKVMNPKFGVGLRTYVFEPNHPMVYKQVEDSLRYQVKKYLPYITIKKVSFTPGQGAQVNLLNVEISYFINIINFSDDLQILVSI